nr:oxygenase MpaB family protein [uncultured Flavobacterium sp.]
MHQKNNTNIPSRFQTSSNAFYDFWKSEGGFSLLKQLPNTPDINLAKQFAPLLMQCDKLADNVVEAHFLYPKTFAVDLEKTLSLICNSNDTNCSSSIIELKKQLKNIPNWLNPQQLQLGAQVCNISGKSGLIVLRNYSLMTGYMSAAINKPLVATGALKKGASKRLAETTEFWVAVTKQNNLNFNEFGFYQCVKTRLIHAFSRKMILNHTDWNINEQGLPLNHWDMLATYLGFSVVFLEGLIKLGFNFTEEEKNATYHLWRYIGYLLGIPDQILPQNHLQAIEALYLWTNTQPQADNDTIMLAKALYLEPILANFPKPMLGKKFIQQVNLAFNHYFIGPKSCNILQLPNAEWFHKSIIIVKYINKLDLFLANNSSFYKQKLISKGHKEQQIILEQAFRK